MAYKSQPTLIFLNKNGIDGKTTGAITIATTDPNGRFVPLFINIEPTTVAGFTSVPTLSVGTNSTAFDNIITATPLTGANTQNMTFPISVPGLVLSVPPSTAIKTNITVGAVGTTYTIRVSVIGFYY